MTTTMLSSVIVAIECSCNVTITLICLEIEVMACLHNVQFVRFPACIRYLVLFKLVHENEQILQFLTTYRPYCSQSLLL